MCLSQLCNLCTSKKSKSKWNCILKRDHQTITRFLRWKVLLFSPVFVLILVVCLLYCFQQWILFPGQTQSKIGEWEKINYKPVNLTSDKKLSPMWNSLVSILQLTLSMKENLLLTVFAIYCQFSRRKFYFFINSST